MRSVRKDSDSNLEILEKAVCLLGKFLKYLPVSIDFGFQLKMSECNVGTGTCNIKNLLDEKAENEDENGRRSVSEGRRFCFDVKGQEEKEERKEEEKEEEVVEEQEEEQEKEEGKR